MSVSAAEFLSSKSFDATHGVMVMYGPERFFRPEILHCMLGTSGEDSESSITRFNGGQAEIRTVLTELRTVSMFGDQRIVMIDDADDFVTAHRPVLEKYVASPAKGSLLILDVKSLPKNTKLFKLVEQHGVAVECAELTGVNLLKWLQRVAKEQYGKTLDRENAALIVQLAGDGLGMQLQEIAKLASLVGDVVEITRDDVTKIVGGWRTETTWVMLDAVRDGNSGKALEALSKLMISGEAPQKILGGVTFTFRKLAEATERTRAGAPLRDAIAGSGIFPNAIAASEAYLRRIGFERASRILQLLIQADTEMKGGSRVDPKLLLERLFVRLAGEPVVLSGT